MQIKSCYKETIYKAAMIPNILKVDANFNAIRGASCFKGIMSMK
jgi:hypothetical protein